MNDYITHHLSANKETFLKNVSPTWKYDESPSVALAKFLSQISRGSFLFSKMVLNLIDSGRIVIKSPSFSVLPKSLSEIFQLEMNLLFPSQQSYSTVRQIFTVCLVSLRPMSLTEIFQCLQAGSISGNFTSWDTFVKSYSAVQRFLPVVDEERQTVSFFHSSFRDWLMDRRTCEQARFGCNARDGHTAKALYLSRKSSQGDGLDGNETLDLAHHLLKSHIFTGAGAKDNQALLIATCCKDINDAITCARNLSNPSTVLSRLLLIAGADPNCGIRSDDIWTPLISHHVAMNNLAMVSLLADYGADVNARNSLGRSPLMVAAESDLVDILEILLTRHKADPGLSSNDGSTALSLAAEKGSMGCLRILLEPAGDWDGRGDAVQEALVRASKESKLEAMDLLIGVGGANVNKASPITNQFPLEQAIRSGAKASCEYLIEKCGSDLSLLSSPLHAAIEVGQAWSIVQLLLKSGCRIDEKDARGRPALSKAAIQGELAIMELLLGKGADVNQADGPEGLTPLAWACAKGKPESVIHLLRREGIDPDCKDRHGRTPLHHAAVSKSSKCIETLLDHGADLEAADRNGIRPIDQAMNYGSIESIRCFLRRGVKLGPTTWAMAKGNPKAM